MFQNSVLPIQTHEFLSIILVFTRSYSLLDIVEALFSSTNWIPGVSYTRDNLRLLSSVDLLFDLLIRVEIQSLFSDWKEVEAFLVEDLEVKEWVAQGTGRALLDLPKVKKRILLHAPYTHG